MQRSLLTALTQWQQQATRKPILLEWARQTGKTYLLKTSLGAQFDTVFCVNFLESAMAEAFMGSLNPQDILMNLELLAGQRITPEDTLFVFDEMMSVSEHCNR
jgi:predicted AAA+ superfamily ATPase